MTLEEAKKRIAELDSGSGFLGSDYESGWEDALCRATEILDEIDTEPVGNLDKLTLTELAKKLREIFKFGYLTVHKNWCQRPFVCMWCGMPRYTNSQDIGGWGGTYCVGSIGLDYAIDLDLSEYVDENGNIDYSKCIVEVSDEA